MSVSRGQTIIAIDLLRFACAMLVLYYHMDAAWWSSPSPHGAMLLPAMPGPGNALSRVGWVGVELFFVISGLVIARSAVDVAAPTFLRRRALRLAPAAWICATVTLAVLSATGRFGTGLAGDWLRSVLFWPTGEQIDESYWTLGVEVYFYLAVAVTIGGRARRERLASLAWIIGLASAGGWVAATIWPQAVMPWMSNQAATLLLLPFGCFFALGMSIGLSDGRPMHGAGRLLVPILLVGSVLEIVAHAAGRQGDLHAPVSAMLASALFLTGVAVIAFAPMVQPGLARVIAPTAARRIGLMTYPLYLLHQDAGAAVAAGLLALGMPVAAIKLMAAAAVLAVAWVVSTQLEPRLRGGMVAAFSRRRALRTDSRPTAFLRGG